MNVPSGYTALDLVGFTDKGTYNALTEYVRNDIAHSGGNLWRCLIDGTIGVTPAEGANWTVFLAEPTSAAEDIIATVEASTTSTHQYAVGKQLILNDILYTVTTAVNIGDTLAVGTNITASDTVVDQIATKANTSSLASVATSGSYADLLNKPTLGTAAAKDVPSSGNASSTEVVMGDDTRLTNARNAADVSAWAKASTKPTYNGSEINTNSAQSGTAQSAISTTIASGTSMDAAVGDLLDNDATLGSEIQTLTNGLANEVSARATLGAHNLYPVTLEAIKTANQYHTWVGNVGTRNGISYTVNTNSGGYVTSIAVSADSATNTGGSLVLGTTKFLTDSYTFSAGGGSSDCFINYRYRINGGSDTIISQVYGTNEHTATVQNTWEVYGRIDVTSGKTVSTTLYPMIRLATDKDNTYQPYTKTNRELTDGKADKSDITDNYQTSPTSNQYIAAGTYFYLDGKLVKSIAIISNGGTFTKNTNYVDATFAADAASKIKGTLSGTATEIGAWSNDTTCNISVRSTTKVFVFNMAADGTVTGTVNNL